jgi:hypothetical protein
VNKTKVEPKTVQGIPRHAKIQTTLDLYTQEDSDESRTAQGEFFDRRGDEYNRAGRFCGLTCGLKFSVPIIPK